MLIEQAAYGNRLAAGFAGRQGAFALAGLLRSFARSPQTRSAPRSLLAALLALLVWRRCRRRASWRVAAPAFGFSALSCLSLLVSGN